MNMLLTVENAAMLRMLTQCLLQLTEAVTMKYFLKKTNNLMNDTLFLIRPKNGVLTFLGLLTN